MLDRIGLETWRYSRTGEILSLEDVLERFGERLPLEIAHEKEPKWLIEIKKNIPVHFIETQRLLNTRKHTKRSSREYDRQLPMPSTVTTYSEEIAETITTKLAESSALSQSLDRTFPRRMVDLNRKKRKTEGNELRNKLTALEQKRSDLMEAGLLDQSSDSVQVDQIDDDTNIVLSVYVEDTEQKLGIFDELANKIELLKRIINKRFLYKKMAISRQDGFVFTTSKGTILPLESLSSGEQHELVLFYELLFRVDPGSLILIDEPEISLHISWQQQFLEDVQEVTPLTDIDILMATHSPDIINNHWDLTVPLEGPHQ
jgi:predicted ATP-binding protein involved in virulence